MTDQSPSVRKVKGSAESTFYTFAYLFKAARVAFDRGTEEPSGSVYQFLNAIVCAAFSLEAYFNHLGGLRYRFWQDIERSTRTHAKLNMLADSLQFEPDMGSRPYQSLKELFSFRNTVAHGKTETLKKEYEKLLGDDSFEELMPDWMAKCEPAFAERMLADVGAVIEDLHSRAHLALPALSTLSTGSRFESVE